MYTEMKFIVTVANVPCNFQVRIFIINLLNCEGKLKS